MFEQREQMQISMSPSVWREWIEIAIKKRYGRLYAGLPPCGGSGLKYKAHRKQGHHTGGLPPCGGSGLKFPTVYWEDTVAQSPSVWREWIEMTALPTVRRKRLVSLRVEGVD